MRKYILLAVVTLLFNVNSIVAQTIWKAQLGDVAETGYYNIELDQRLIGGATNRYLTDLRLYAQKDTSLIETPYFLRDVNPVKEIREIKNYKLERNVATDSLNIVVVENPQKQSLDRFYIVINNVDVKIEVSVRGSNNLSQWYVVKQQTRVYNLRESDDNEALLIVDFPKGNYSYYEITLINNQKSPLEVKNVCQIENTSMIYGQFAEIQLGQFTTKEHKDENKTEVSFPDLKNYYRINKLDFKIPNTLLYYRTAEIVDTVKNNSEYLNLSAKKENSFLLNDYLIGANTIIEIKNENNPPLQIDSITVYGLKRYICAYLEKGQAYTIETGDPENSSVDYDIERFRGEISTDLPTITLRDVQSFEKPPEPEREKLFIENPIFLWGCIILVGAFLIFICIKMIMKLNKTEEN